VQVKGDTVGESTESFSVILSGASNAFPGDVTGTVTILDDEPRITIDDVSSAEGNSGTKAFTFTLHLSAASTSPVSVNYSTAEGDTDFYPYNPYSYYSGPPAATSDTDFVSKTGTATFAAGQTSTTVTVLVNGDRTAEADEAFSLNLDTPSGALMDDAHAVATIINDEPYVNVVGGSVTEGNSGTQLLPFTITLSSASDVAVTVNYATSDGTARAGTDYVAKSSSVTFAAGETSKTVNVTVNGDRIAEGDESLQLVLGTVTNAGVGSGYASGYILDNEPRISINSVSTAEGNGKPDKLMTFTVTLSAAYDQAVSVNYATQNGSARSGKDYSAKSGTITFAARETSKTITVSIKGDRQREPNKTLYVVLSNPSVNALIGNGTGSGTILNDD
jgi:chitinase